MSVPFSLVNVFAATPFTGNGAAVCLLEGPAEPRWMQRVATELGQPTTAFAHSGADGQQHLRWFTPTTELPLCGHATLAAAHVLAEAGACWTATPSSPDPVQRFATPAGELTVRTREGLLWLDLPAVHLAPAPAPPSLVEALGVEADHVRWFGHHEEADFVAVLDTAERVEDLRPDIERIRSLPVTRTVVTAAGGHGVDFTSRVFVPVLGLDEDQATGSAHAVLGPLWRHRLDRTRMRAAQASARRGSLSLEVRDEQVAVGSGVITLARGELTVLGA